MIIKYGFEINGIKYGWYNKELYRLPYYKNKRSYQLRRLIPQMIGSTVVFSIGTRKKTKANLLEMTSKFSEPYMKQISDDLPY